MTEYLNDKEHIVRYASNSKIHHDDDGKPLGFFPAAFTMRLDEDTLSSTWLEYFDGTKLNQLKCVAEVMKNDEVTIRKSGAFAISNVGQFKQICNEQSFKIRIIHEPSEKNPAYSVVRGYPRDADNLFGLLADNAEIIPMKGLLTT